MVKIKAVFPKHHRSFWTRFSNLASSTLVRNPPPSSSVSLDFACAKNNLHRMDWSERGWNHCASLFFEHAGQTKILSASPLGNAKPSALAWLFSHLVVSFYLSLCMSGSLGLSLAHRFCLAPVKLQFVQCSWHWLFIPSFMPLCHFMGFFSGGHSQPPFSVLYVWLHPSQLTKGLWSVETVLKSLASFFFPIFRDFSNYLILQIEHHLYPIYQAKYCLSHLFYCCLRFVRSSRTFLLPSSNLLPCAVNWDELSTLILLAFGSCGYLLYNDQVWILALAP